MTFGNASFNFFEDRTTAEVVLPLSTSPAPQIVPPFYVAPGGLHALEVAADVRTPSYQEKSGNRESQYNIPVRYVVRDANELPLASDTGRIESSAGVLRFRRNETFDEQTDTMKFGTTTRLGTFHGPDSGDVSVEIEVLPDNLYGAQLESLELHVHENIRDNRTILLTAGGLCCTSPLLLALGLALLIYGPVVMSVARSGKR
jgi:hypothetical protein